MEASVGIKLSGTNAEFTKADTVIFRTDLHNLTTGKKEYNFKRTLKYDSKWLDSKFNCIIYLSCYLHAFFVGGHWAL